MMTERRKNRALAAAIEQTIELDRTQGCAVAWAYGTKWGVPASTLTRVLSLGGSRRGADSELEAEPPCVPQFAVLDIVSVEDTRPAVRPKTDVPGST